MRRDVREAVEVLGLLEDALVRFEHLSTRWRQAILRQLAHDSRGWPHPLDPLLRGLEEWNHGIRDA